MKKIKLKYLDFWEGFNHEKYRITQMLTKHFDIEISDEPDYVVSSVFSKDFLNYDCVRIFYTGENFCPDFNLFDYAIGFENMAFGDRNVWYPNWLMNLGYDKDVKYMQEKHLSNRMNKEEFCSFVVSNGCADEFRTLFFEELSKYKKVNSGGVYLNNIGVPEGIIDKLDFQLRHKFSICFENSSHPGYITEKIVQGFAARTIPIYWGAPDIEKIFNKNAMVAVDGFGDIHHYIDRIRIIDNDPEIYLSMLSQAALVDELFVEKCNMNLERFLINIFEQPINRAIRRPKGQTVRKYYFENNINNKSKVCSQMKKKKNWITRIIK